MEKTRGKPSRAPALISRFSFFVLRSPRHRWSTDRSRWHLYLEALNQFGRRELLHVQGKAVILKHSVRFALLALIGTVLLTAGAPLLVPAIAQDKGETATGEPIRLTLGQGLTRNAKDGSRDRFKIELRASDYVRVVLTFLDVDLSTRVYATDHNPLLEMNTSDTPGGSISISWVAKEAGSYEVEVRPEPGGYPYGPFTVEITDIRPARSQEMTSAEAELLFSQGETLQREGTEASLKAALEKYVKAIDLWRKNNDERQLAEALNKSGQVHYGLGQNKESVGLLNDALEIVKLLPNERLERAAILQSLGEAYNALADQNKALDALHEALDLRHGRAGASREADTLNDIGAVADDLGRKAEALEYYNRALMLKRQIGDRDAEGSILNNMALVADDLGEKRTALQNYLAVIPLLHHPKDRGSALNNIGLDYENLGEIQNALEYYNQALANSREAGDHRQEAQTLRNLAALYIDIGDADAALDYLNRSLPVTRAAGDRRGEANSLRHLGELLREAGKNQQALETLNQALAGSQAIGDRRGEIADLLQLAKTYSASGEKIKAIDFLNRGVAVADALGDRTQLASLQNNLGEVYVDSDPDKALQHFTSARELAIKVDDPDIEAAALYGLARSEHQIGHREAARTHVEEAISIIESLRTKISDASLETTFLASRQKSYQLDITLLMELNREHPGEGLDAQAFEVSERARARSLIDLLSEAKANIRKGVDPDLLELEQSLKSRLAAQNNLELRLERSEHTLDQANALKKVISDLLRQYGEVEAKIRERSPRYAALTTPDPLKLKDFQKQVLDSDTMLLEYSLGEERSYVWAVSDTSLASFELPPRAEIEAVARLVYGSLARRAAQGGEAIPPPAANEPKDHEPAPVRLSRIVLGPVARMLTGKRLLIVSEGALQYVPFEALPSPENLEADGTPLVAEHEIVTLPSASVVAMLRRDTPNKETSLRTVAVLADPVFDSQDPRIHKNGLVPASQSESLSPAQRGADPSELVSVDQRRLTRSSADVGLHGGGTPWPRLVFTRREAASIFALTSSGNGMQALDFTANRSIATGPELGHYQIIHFATHGLLNSEHPELSGLVLSLVDENGKAENGFLELEDIYNLNLNAELVVLSACETGLGKDIKGEGLVGLTRGFMYAGSPRVVASLWRVDDVATADLMKRFYRGILHDGQRPAAALRQAQLEMWRQKRWQEPYYWAGFTMQGDWR